MKFAIFALIIFLALVESKSVKNLRNESSAYKRMQDLAFELAASLLNTIVIRKHTGTVHSGQFGALYLHASAVDAILRLDHGEALSTNFPAQIDLATKDTFVWPADDETNLAVATKNQSLGLRGHSEYLLLKKLAAMLTYFQGIHQPVCPTYIVIFTKLPPCHKASDPNRPVLGCTTEIINRFNEARNICPHPATRYVVGYHEMAKTPNDVAAWENAQQLLEAQNILVRQV